MTNDIDKLVKYQDQIQELNELKKKLGDEEPYDKVEVVFPPNTIIKVQWSNKEGSFAKSMQFPFSAISDVGERTRKKIDYRNIKLEKASK